MGGNAIKSAKRIDKKTFDQYWEELKQLFPELKMDIVKSFYQKKDFGDIDIVVEKRADLNIKKLIVERIFPTEIYDNNMFYSILYKDAQIDFIFMSANEYESSLAYFAWNDFGNFCGRASRALNFKYGHDGLSFSKHYSDSYVITIEISNNTKDILEFLGYDYNTWLKGFDTEEDIFKYAASSEYFNPLYFTLEDQSHNDRVRNKKRKMYQKMLAYIEANNLDSKPKLSQEERHQHLIRACEFFNKDFISILNAEEEKYKEHIKFKELFNGDIVSEITGLTGKELGQFIRRFKEWQPNLKDYVLKLDKSEAITKIKNMILEWMALEYDEENSPEPFEN